LFLKFRGWELNDKCPSGVKTCECVNAPGTTTEGPFFWEDDPISVMITYVGCNPGFCTCNNGNEVDTRPPPIAAVLDTCEKHEISKCLCEDNTKLNYPFDIIGLFTCKPKRVCSH
jgi:hypothetical protein